tara:strand:- start:212 stop:412 length:201 start_codon:yes stop_codon:yes gene_type:complete
MEFLRKDRPGYREPFPTNQSRYGSGRGQSLLIYDVARLEEKVSSLENIIVRLEQRLSQLEFEKKNK